MTNGTVVYCPIYNVRREDNDFNGMFNNFTNGVLTPIIIVCGCIANCIFIHMVFKMFTERRSVRLALMIIIMGTFDTLLLLVSFFYYAVKDMMPQYRSFFNMYTPFLHGVGQVANTGSIWSVTVIVTLKHLAVGDPFRGPMSSRVLHSFRTQRKPSGPHKAFNLKFLHKADLLIPVLLIIADVLFNIPAFFEIDVKKCLAVEGTHWENMLYLHELRKNWYYRKFYKVAARMLLVSCVPNIYIFIMTAYTLYRLRKVDQDRRILFLSENDDAVALAAKEQMQTMSSVLLGLKFLILRSPAFISDILEGVYDIQAINKVLFINAVNVSNCSILLNSATNCLMFVKLASWMKRRMQRINTIKKKKRNQFLCLHNTPRLDILYESWKEILDKTDNRLGERLLHSMITKDIDAYNLFKLPPLPPAEPPKYQRPAGTPVSASVISNGRKYGTADTCLLLSKKKSIEMCKNPKFFEVSQRIISFIGDLIDALRRGDNIEKEVIGNLRRIGNEHNKMNIRFTNQMWSEFKKCFMNAVAECERESQTELEELKRTWNSFISMIIKEIKHGAYVSQKTGKVTQI